MQNQIIFRKELPYKKESGQALENAGYSTVRNADGVAVYADKLIALIEKYNLMEYDNKVK